MADIELRFQKLIDALQSIERVLAIGKTGGAAVSRGGGDIDLFVFCEKIPVREEREVCYASLSDALSVSEYGESEHPHWGLVDSLLIDGREAYPMYFSLDAFRASVDSILRGERTQREKNYFYPTGRCASLLGMHAFYDPHGIIAELKKRCASYPDALRCALINSHLPKIYDEEDFLRAVSRGDVLFYHSTLDLALDHFLQALFALNRVYFPSRKSSLELIETFSIKPEGCREQLLRAVLLGAQSETLTQSRRVWNGLCAALTLLIRSDPSVHNEPR